MACDDCVVSACYTSVACARCPHSVDWSPDGLVCYAASDVVILYNSEIKNGDPIISLHHHKAKINAVRFITDGIKTPIELISCSGDKTAALWTKMDNQWSVSDVLEGHSDGVTCADGLYLDNNSDSLLVFTASIDSTVRIWQRKNGCTVCQQTISLGSGLCLVLRATFLPGTRQPLLICSLDDDKIYLFAEDSTHAEFHKVTALVGHEDWVRGLDVMTLNPNSLLLASSSQDTYIRLWSITRHMENTTPSASICVEKKVFETGGEKWASELHAILAGHEGWVYAVQWHPPLLNSDGSTTPVYKLLSSSLDKTVILWEPDKASGEGLWAEHVRVGEVGGNGLGFYGSRFGPSGQSFLAHGYNGTFHVWALDEETQQWSPSVVPGGHFGAVADMRWEPRHGRYLMSVSEDQTTRVHAPCYVDGHTEWHEIARPQIHGFDMSSLAPVSSGRFASGAEEKVIRAFSAPHNFVYNFKNITGMELNVEEGDDGPEGAAVPSLGLSNKAVFTGDAGDSKEFDSYFVPVNLTGPPTEETLMQNTMWPETQKLYGHGYEVFALDASGDGALLASACKASTAEHAAILLWDTQEWRQIQKLVSHQLTVTQLAFSPDSSRLLSVSRDRRWTLFRRGDSLHFTQMAASDKTNGVHARIIWCCAWMPDSNNFATGSRDGKICVWADTGKSTDTSLGSHALRVEPLQLANESVTALAFAITDAPIMAAGFERGVIRIYLIDGEQSRLLKELDNSMAHHKTVTRLQFRPAPGAAGVAPGVANDVILQLASGGADHLLRVYNARFSKNVLATPPLKPSVECVPVEC